MQHTLSWFSCSHKNGMLGTPPLPPSFYYSHRCIHGISLCKTYCVFSLPLSSFIIINYVWHMCTWSSLMHQLRQCTSSDSAGNRSIEDVCTKDHDAAFFRSVQLILLAATPLISSFHLTFVFIMFFTFSILAYFAILLSILFNPCYLIPVLVAFFFFCTTICIWYCLVHTSWADMQWSVWFRLWISDSFCLFFEAKSRILLITKTA